MILQFARSRGGTVGTHAVAQSGDSVTMIDFSASDGAAFISAARIESLIDGTPGTNDMPGRLSLQTTPDGSASPSEALRLDNAQQAFFPGISTTGSDANAFLDSGSSPANQLLRSTSSRRYKRDIRYLDDSEFDPFAVIEGLRGALYKSLSLADDLDRDFYGFIAEDAAEVDPKLVHWRIDPETGEPQPDGVQYARLAVIHNEALKNINARLAAAGI